MKIRIAKAFNGYKVGQEFDWGDGMARVLIGRGMVTPVVEGRAPDAAGNERAVDEVREIETAAMPRRKKK